jgi:biopolymer transport protein ExbD
MRRKLHSSHLFDPLEEPVMNLTPLIDVVFAILITFIVIAPLVEIDDVQLAFSSGKEIEMDRLSKEPVIVHVKADGEIVINKQKIAQSELKQVLRKLKESYPDAIPQVYHDKRAAFGTYQTLKNSFESVGYERMDIVLLPEGS